MLLVCINYVGSLSVCLYLHTFNQEVNEFQTPQLILSVDKFKSTLTLATVDIPNRSASVILIKIFYVNLNSKLLINRCIIVL